MWRPMDTAPHSKLILIKGRSGYMAPRDVLVMSAYRDDEYRPPIKGEPRWLTPGGDQVEMCGPPEGWLLIPE
jgi:hypothetical protein